MVTEKRGTGMVRRASMKDFDEIMRIALESLGYSFQVEKSKASLRDMLGNDNHWVLVAEESGSILGFLWAETRISIWSDPYIYVNALASDSKSRGKGIGKELLTSMEKIAHEMGISEIILHSGEERVLSHGFYRHNGFTCDRVHLRFRKKTISKDSSPCIK